MLKPRAAIVCSFVLWVLASSLTADESAAPEIGARIRVHFGQTDWEPLVGKLTALEQHELTVTPATGAPRAVALRDVSRLERSLHPSRKGKGARVGFLAGFAAGVLLVGLACSTDSCTGGEALIVGSLAGAVLGTPGALVGALVAPGERWEQLSLHRPPLAGPSGPAQGSDRPPSVQPPRFGKPFGLGVGIIQPSHRDATVWLTANWRLRLGDHLHVEPDVGFWAHHPDRNDALSNSLSLGANLILAGGGSTSTWVGAGAGVQVTRYGGTIAGEPFYYAYPALTLLAGVDRRVSRRITLYAAARIDYWILDWQPNGMKVYAGFRVHR